MRLNRGFRVGLILVVILVALSSVFSYFYVNSRALADDFENSLSLVDNNYEKFSGEKILLNSKEDDLNGDWGTLELTPFIIQPLEDFFVEQINYSQLFKMYNSSRQWVFKDANLKDIRSLFTSSGLSKETCDELLANTTAIPEGKGFVTTPPDEVLWSLTPEIRTKLYPLIGKYSDNLMYSEPISYNFANAEEWFYNSGLRKELVEKILPLVYIENGICYISDIHLILPLLKNDNDRISLLQTMYRTRALDVYLKVGEGQDVSKMTGYWGRLGRTESIKPILESMSNNPGGGKIAMTELLPEIPANRLNTYSGIEEYVTDYKDCHWTTINFFNNELDERYYNLPDLLLFINTISKPLKNAQPKFGDIVSIFDENNELMHSCTYIADNLVLTKNGMGNLNPFVLTYLDKTIPLYGERTVFSSRTVSDTHAIELESWD